MLGSFSVALLLINMIIFVLIELKKTKEWCWARFLLCCIYAWKEEVGSQYELSFGYFMYLHRQQGGIIS